VALIKITVLPENRIVEVDPSKMPYADHGRPGSFLDIFMNHGVEIEHACGGSCACTTCHLIVVAGDANVSPIEEDEADRLDMAAGLTLHSRLGCQAIPKGDVTVEIPDWNRNYVSAPG
jgi:2Fe-2S ferredoxin